MKKKHVLRHLCAICGLTMLLSCPVTAQACDIPAQPQAAGGEAIEPQADVIEWIFKTENGHRYRRLFNHSKQEWIGDWIPCD